MRQTLILHIGTHKTGSTTIQNYLYYNRLWLRIMGVFYPRPINGRLFFTNNHSDLRDTALCEGKHRNAHIHPEFGSHDALLGRYIRAIKQAGQPINILSAEGWSSHLNRYAHRLSPLAQHFDVKILAFMRRPDFWIEKFYAQRITNIEHRETRSFKAFLDQPHIETYLYNRHRMFRWWAKAFGPDALQVIPYEPASPDFDLIGHFLTASNSHSRPARNLLFRNAKANQTLDAKNTENLRQMIAAGKPVNSRLVRDMKNAQRDGGGFLTDNARAAIIERAEPDMARICKDYVKDGREVLFSTCPEKFNALEKRD